MDKFVDKDGKEVLVITDDNKELLDEKHFKDLKDKDKEEEEEDTVDFVSKLINRK